MTLGYRSPDYASMFRRFGKKKDVLRIRGNFAAVNIGIFNLAAAGELLFRSYGRAGFALHEGILPR
jgi:hypothetical protein